MSVVSLLHHVLLNIIWQSGGQDDDDEEDGKVLDEHKAKEMGGMRMSYVKPELKRKKTSLLHQLYRRWLPWEREALET